MADKEDSKTPPRHSDRWVKKNDADSTILYIPDTGIVYQSEGPIVDGESGTVELRGPDPWEKPKPMSKDKVPPKG